MSEWKGHAFVGTPGSYARFGERSDATPNIALRELVRFDALSPDDQSLLQRVEDHYSRYEGVLVDTCQNLALITNLDPAERIVLRQSPEDIAQFVDECRPAMETIAANRDVYTGKRHGKLETEKKEHGEFLEMIEHFLAQPATADLFQGKLKQVSREVGDVMAQIIRDNFTPVNKSLNPKIATFDSQYLLSYAKPTVSHKIVNSTLTLVSELLPDPKGYDLFNSLTLHKRIESSGLPQDIMAALKKNLDLIGSKPDSEREALFVSLDRALQVYSFTMALLSEDSPERRKALEGCKETEFQEKSLGDILKSRLVGSLRRENLDLSNLNLRKIEWVLGTDFSIDKIEEARKRLAYFDSPEFASDEENLKTLVSGAAIVLAGWRKKFDQEGQESDFKWATFRIPEIQTLQQRGFSMQVLVTDRARRIASFARDQNNSPLPTESLPVLMNHLRDYYDGNRPAALLPVIQMVMNHRLGINPDEAEAKKLKRQMHERQIEEQITRAPILNVALNVLQNGFGHVNGKVSEQIAGLFKAHEQTPEALADACIHLLQAVRSASDPYLFARKDLSGAKRFLELAQSALKDLNSSPREREENFYSMVQSEIERVVEIQRFLNNFASDKEIAAVIGLKDTMNIVFPVMITRYVASCNNKNGPPDSLNDLFFGALEELRLKYPDLPTEAKAEAILKFLDYCDDEAAKSYSFGVNSVGLIINPYNLPVEIINLSSKLKGQNLNGFAKLVLGFNIGMYIVNHDTNASGKRLIISDFPFRDKPAITLIQELLIKEPLQLTSADKGMLRNLRALTSDPYLVEEYVNKTSIVQDRLAIMKNEKEKLAKARQAENLILQLAKENGMGELSLDEATKWLEERSQMLTLAMSKDPDYARDVVRQKITQILDSRLNLTEKQRKLLYKALQNYIPGELVNGIEVWIEAVRALLEREAPAASSFLR